MGKCLQAMKLRRQSMRPESHRCNSGPNIISLLLKKLKRGTDASVMLSWIGYFIRLLPWPSVREPVKVSDRLESGQLLFIRTVVSEKEAMLLGKESE